jgi:hypothetical protein
MFSDEIAYLVNKECHKDRLRELERQRLIQTAGLQQANNKGWPGKVANWAASQLVEWGSKLQPCGPVQRQVKR